MVLNRLVSWLFGLSLLMIFELTLSQPKNSFGFMAVSFLLLVLSVWRLAGYQFSRVKFWNFFITPFIFLASSWLFIIFLDGGWLRQLVIFAVVVLNWLFLKVMFLYLYHRPKYQAHTLGNISGYISLVSVFFLIAGFFSLKIFLGISFWPLTGAVFIIVVLLIYQLLLASQVPISSIFPYATVIALVLSEIFIVVNLLPVSIYVSSLVVSLSYYLLSGLSRNWLLNIKERGVLIRYLTIGLTSLIIILASAKWI